MKSPWLRLDEVRQVFEFDGEIDIIHGDGVGHVQDDWREIKDSGDAGFEEAVGGFLGGGGGNGEDGQLDASAADERGELVHLKDRLVKILAALATDIFIEAGDDFKTLLGESGIAHERAAQAADADNDDGLEAVGAEGVAESDGEQFDIVAKSAGAEVAEVGKVFAELGGGDAGDLGERFAGDGADAVVVEALEAAEIEGEAVEGFARNGGFHGRCLSA